MKRYEVTYILNDLSGKTLYLTERECIERFGKDEWPEYRDGCLPHVVVCEIYD